MSHLHKGRHDGVFHQNSQCPRDTQIIGRHRLARRRERNDHAAQPVAHVHQRRCEGKHGHDLARNRDVKARLALVPLFRWPLPYGNSAQVAVAHVEHALPRDGSGVDIEAHEARALFARHVRGRRSRDVKLCGATLLNGGPKRGALVRGEELAEEFHVICRRARLVEHACLERSRAEVCSGSNSMDIPRQMQVEFLHRNDLCVTATRCAALDAESGPLGWLADRREDALTKVRAECLANANRCRRLTLAQRRRVYACHDDVVAVADGSEAVAHGERHLRFVATVVIELLL